MMTKKFEVGAKVRVVHDVYGERRSSGQKKRNPRLGDVGVVTAHIFGYNVVRFSGEVEPTNSVPGDDGWRFSDDWLEPALRFAVGDKVVIAGCADDGYIEARGAKVGDVGTIAEAKPARQGIFDYIVQFDGRRERLGFNDADLAPYVEPAHAVVEYGVGDRVKVRTAYQSRKPHEQTTQTGVIFEKRGSLAVKYDKHDGLAGWDMLTSVEVLEVIEKAKPTKPALKVGDKVRVVKNVYGRQHDYYIGHVGVVRRVLSDELDVEFADVPDAYCKPDELELIDSTPATPKAPPVVTIAVSNLRFTRKNGNRVIVEANGKRVASVSVEELRKMVDVIEGEAK